jgi:hypothetical protein
MRFFQPPADARFYAGVDLHARPLFLCVLDRDGQQRLARNLAAAARERSGGAPRRKRKPLLPHVITKPGLDTHRYICSVLFAGSARTLRRCHS